MSGAVAIDMFEELDAAVSGNAAAQQGQQPALSGLALAAVENLKKIRDELKAFYIGPTHHEVIDNLILALAIGEHLLMLGDPGLGKSDMTRELFYRIRDSKGNVESYFEILMSKATDPSELAGPIDMEEYKKGRFVRQTKGMLPEAYGAFIDEAFKANSVALNFLLAALNERVFHNGGQKVQIPLRMAVMASNEGPEDESLNALYDRILFRLEIREPDDGDQFMQILENINAKRNGTWKWPHGYATVTTEQLEALSQVIDQVQIPRGIFEAFKELREKLKAVGIHVTTRRWGKCLTVVKGHAVLNGRTTVTRNDFNSLVHVLADKPNDKEQVRVIIKQMCEGPWLSKLKQYLADAENRKNQYFSMPEVTEDQRKIKGRAGLAVKTELVKLMKAVNNVLKDAQANGEDMTELLEIQKQIVNINAEVVKYLNQKAGIVSPIDTSETEDFGF